jgi:hypothetical protein
MIKTMAGTSPERTTLRGPASAEVTHIPSHRRFNRPAVYDRAIDADLPQEQQSLDTAVQPELAETQAPATKKHLVIALTMAVFLIAASVTFALAYLRDRRSTAVETEASVQAMSPRSAPLGMWARQQAENLLLSWDGKSQAVQSATDGLLQIDDGPQHREIALDHAAIASGSMLYKPTSDDIVFRLEIRGKEGVRGAESLEVVGPRSRTAELEPPRPSAPAQEAKPEPISRNAENSLPAAVVSKRHGSKKVNSAKPGSQALSRRSPKLSAAVGRAPRPSGQPMDARAKAPALSMASIAAAQPSPFSTQQLPKPPPESSTVVAKSTTHSTESAGSPTRPSSPVRDSISRDGTKSLPASYVPPRPVKWTAPSAKSLGISRMSAATDVQIKVKIDDSGRVTAAHALLDGSTHNEAVTAAVTAAVKQWIFEPAKMQGKNVPSEETVVIRVGP